MFLVHQSHASRSEKALRSKRTDISSSRLIPELLIDEEDEEDEDEEEGSVVRRMPKRRVTDSLVSSFLRYIDSVMKSLENNKSKKREISEMKRKKKHKLISTYLASLTRNLPLSAVDDASKKFKLGSE